jgi:hypothetical protein
MNAPRRLIVLALAAALLALWMSNSAWAHGSTYFDDDHCGSTLSCASETVGDLIAFPFRVVGNVVDYIF